MTVRSLISVHRLRYFRFCNVLHIWTIRAIPTYRVIKKKEEGLFLKEVTVVEFTKNFKSWILIC